MNKDILALAGFKKEVERIDNNQCPICEESIDMNDFNDSLSRKEFQISGMCQNCQNKVFKGEEC